MDQKRPIPTERLRTIRGQMVERFSLDELRALTFDLGANWDELPGANLSARTTELLALLNRRTQLPALLAHLQTLRPDDAWALDDLDESAVSPYKGLEFYDEADAGLFFGRERLIATLLDALRGQSFLAVVGASGSGKSSVVRAGVAPVLKGHRPPPDGAAPVKGSAGWAYLEMTPTDKPLEQLALTLTRDLDTVGETRAILRDVAEDPAALHLYLRKYLERQNKPRAFLLVDQFEELFTLCKDEPARVAFIDGLLGAAAGGATTVVITLRADFYHHCLRYPGLRDALQQRQQLIGAMSEAELRAAVELPAQRTGYELEPGLADLIVRDAGDAGGALPLLSHALLETWRRREGRRLTHFGYNEAGGVGGAIARTAERAYGDLDPAQQAVARRIFLQLTELGEGAEDTRRVVGLSNLLAGDAAARNEAETVLNALSRARLVTTDDQGAKVQVTHEALIREWPALQEWLRDNREALRLERRLEAAAKEWSEGGRDPSYLYDGAQLAAAREWADAYKPNLNDTVRDFLDAATVEEEREAEERERAQEEKLTQAERLAEEATARERAQARVTRTFRRAAVVVGVLAVLAGLAAVLAFVQRNAAVAARDGASSRALSFAALLIGGEKPTLALLLAVEAGRTRDTAEAFNTLRPALLAPGIEKLALPHDGAVNQATWNGDESRILTGSSRAAQVWDAATSELLLALPHEAPVTQATWNGDESRILTVSADGTVRVWDAATRELLLALPHETPVTQATWNGEESRILTAGIDGTARVWDAVRGQELLALTHEDSVYQATWNGDESRILTASGDSAQVWDAATGKELLALPHEDMVNQATWSSGGNRILTASDDGTARVWNTATGEELLALPHESKVNQATWNGDESHILTASDGAARVWNASTGEELLALPHEGWVKQAIWNSDESRILTVGLLGRARVWNAVTGEELLALSHEGWVKQAIWNSDGSRILTADSDGIARIWNVLMDQELLALQHEGPVIQATWNRDESRILTASDDGTARVWDAATGKELLALPYEGPVNQATWNGDESRILTASDDGTARVWDAATGEELLALPHEGTVLQATWNGDESHILAVSYDSNRFTGTARVWDAATGKEVLALFHEQEVNQAVWNGDENRILTADGAGAAQVWDAATGQVLLALPHEGAVTQATWNRDGSSILTASNKFSLDSTVRVWDAVTGEELLVLPHEGMVTQATWNGDESRILTTVGGMTRVWDAATGQEQLALLHEGVVSQAAWNNDETRILTAHDSFFGVDGTARVWDAATGEELFTLVGDGTGVLDARWNNDESRIMLASRGGQIIVYYTQMEDLIAIACQRLGRNMTWSEWEQYFSGEPYRQTCPNLPVHYTVPEEARP